MVLLPSSDCDRQHAIGQFAVKCEAVRIASSRFWGELLPQVKEFKHLWVWFISEVKMECEMNRWIGTMSAVMWGVYQIGQELWVEPKQMRSWVLVVKMIFLR